MMKKGLILVIILAAGLVLLSLDLSREKKSETIVVKEGHPAPSFQLSTPAGDASLDSSQLKGRVVFLNFWASWCQPCKDEMPSIQEVYNKTRSDDRFVMLTVLYGDKPADALRYMQGSGYNFPVYADPKEIYKTYGVTGVPETYVIDKKGILRKKVIGPLEWTQPEETAFISSLLNE